MTFAAALASQADAAVQRYQGPRGPAPVEAAVRNASAKTGVDFSYLMEKAAVESGFRTDIKASTSSATGLYQFIDSTWLNTVKQHGAAHGLDKYANAIQMRSDGRAYVADPDMRRNILELRKDPTVSALMAAEFTKDNKEYLEDNVKGVKVGATELYMAHFLGAGGASKFLNAMKESPNKRAADLFPDAAAANRPVFFDKDTGAAKTLQDIYQRFSRKFQENGNIVSADANFAARLNQRDMPDGFTTQVLSSPTRALGNNVLSMYQVLALNALETPDEAETGTITKAGETKSPGAKAAAHDHKRMRDQPVRSDQTIETGLGLGLGRQPLQGI